MEQWLIECAVLRVRSLKQNKFSLCASGSGVEHHLAKVGAAGSNPVSRSFYFYSGVPFYAALRFLQDFLCDCIFLIQNFIYIIF